MSGVGIETRGDDSRAIRTTASSSGHNTGDTNYGWNGFGEYFGQKKQKLFEQNEELRRASEANGDGPATPGILKDIVVYIDGLTDPPAHELKKIVLHNGGYVNQYPTKTTITHVIAENLTLRKFDQWKNMKVVTSKWITESVAAGKLLPWQRYRLVLNSASQSRIEGFARTGSSSGLAKEDEEPSSEPVGEASDPRPVSQRGQVLVAASDDEHEQTEEDPNRGQGYKEHQSEHMVEESDPVDVERPLEPVEDPPDGPMTKKLPAAKSTIVLDDDDEAGPAPELPTATFPTKHPAPRSQQTTPTKQQQQPGSANASPTTRSIHPELQSEWARKNSSIAPDFLEKFYGNSRLHHISAAKMSMQDFVRRETEGMPRRPVNPDGKKTVMVS
jgi:DNA repair protein REV1